MNITTYSPALTLLFAFSLVWILMGVKLKSFNKTQRWLIITAVAILCVANHLLRELIGPEAYGKLLILCLHLPTFLMFLFIAKRGVVKTAFMIMTAVVFTTPAVLIGNIVRRVLFEGSPYALLFANLISYALILLLVQFVFKSGFNHLIAHGDTRLFLIFSIVPVIFYIYVQAAVNLDFSELTSASGYVVRLTPSVAVFVFYFMLPYIYKSIRDTQLMRSAQAALKQQLDSSEEQLALLNETNRQVAVYRHDMRHQLTLLDGLLSSGKTEQAQEFIRTVMADLDTLTPKRFCENETVNLLCCSYDGKAERMGVQLRINALLPKKLALSDTELCSVISNGLENALHAASQSEDDKWVAFDCRVKQNKIFIQIQNPYVGEVVIRDELPVSDRDGHGYGCQSIQTIVQRNGGHSSFEAENGLFTLRLVIPFQE